MVFSFRSPQNQLPSHSRGIHLFAGFEAFKGLLVLIVGFGFFEYIDGNAQMLADMTNAIVEHLHLNPAHKYPHIFLKALSKVSDQNILWLAVGAFIYSSLRFIEAYGLWKSRVWAQWLALISAGLYIPVEIVELAKGFSYVKAIISFFNVLIVVYLFYIRFWSISEQKHIGQLTKDESNSHS